MFAEQFVASSRSVVLLRELGVVQSLMLQQMSLGYCTLSKSCHTALVLLPFHMPMMGLQQLACGGAFCLLDRMCHCQVFRAPTRTLGRG